MRKCTKLEIVPDQAGIILEKQTRILRKKNKLIVNVQTIIDLNIQRTNLLIDFNYKSNIYLYEWYRELRLVQRSIITAQVPIESINNRTNGSSIWNDNKLVITIKRVINFPTVLYTKKNERRNRKWDKQTSAILLTNEEPRIIGLAKLRIKTS